MQYIQYCIKSNIHFYDHFSYKLNIELIMQPYSQIVEPDIMPLFTYIALFVLYFRLTYFSIFISLVI